MSQNNSILNILNLKDENIIFDENEMIEIKKDKKGNEIKVFKAKLVSEPKACEKCGHIRDSKIIKNGTYTSKIKLPKISEYPAMLLLKKQRYFCSHCNSTFSAKTTIVDANSNISKNTKIAIALKAKKMISQKDIAEEYNVSSNTVNRVIKEFYIDYQANIHYLPKHLCFDEFKSVKEVSGKMSFIFCNSETAEIIDIVDDRRLTRLESYFMRYTKAARMQVKTVVIDMYSPYMTLIKKVFPNAKIILDRFHIVQLFTRSLNKTRIRIMNHYKKDSKEYKRLKKYWKLLLKARKDINYIDQTFNRSFKKQMREIDILNYLLGINKELEQSYEYYQTLRTMIDQKLYKGLLVHMSANIEGISPEMKISVKSLNRYQDYVINALKYEWNNGVIEGLNNKVKLIKRISFGYKSFESLRRRIFIMQNVTRVKGYINSPAA